MGGELELVVEGRRWLRDAIAGWLEDAEIDVLACPGPTAPDYECTGIRRGSCVLAAVADAVVLDLRLQGEVAHAGAPAFDLMLAYGKLGKPVVLLTGPSDPVVPFRDATTRLLPRPNTREEVVREVGTVLNPPRVRPPGSS